MLIGGSGALIHFTFDRMVRVNYSHSPNLDGRDDPAHLCNIGVFLFGV